MNFVVQLQEIFSLLNSMKNDKKHYTLLLESNRTLKRYLA